MITQIIINQTLSLMKKYYTLELTFKKKYDAPSIEWIQVKCDIKSRMMCNLLSECNILIITSNAN